MGTSRVSDRRPKRVFRQAHPIAGTATLMLTALWLLSMASCGSDEGNWPEIERSGVLRVAIDPTFPPFEYTGPEGLMGLDVDLAQAVAGELELRAEFVHLSYDGLYDALGSWRADAIVSALIVAPDRTRDFAFSRSYFDAGETLFFPESDVPIEKMEELSGRTLAVELGAQGHVEAIAWSRRLPGLHVVTFNSGDEALAAVIGGEADAALVDTVTGRLFGMKQPGLQRSRWQVTSEPYAIVVRRDDATLLEKLDSALERVQSSGQLQEIVERWLGE